MSSLRTLFGLIPVAALLSGCAIEDSRLATAAQKRLLGMNEVDLETCLGSPDQHSSFGNTDILTYEFTSTSSRSWSLPIVQGPSFSNGGNCRMTVRFDHRTASRILYSGEKNATGAPDAYCAPLIRTCLATLNDLRSEKGTAVSTVPPAAEPPFVRQQTSSDGPRTSSGT